jgi:enoyl-CoA hydratase/carnithine racemase
MSDLIITERNGHVMRLTLNRPASLNAMSDAMLAALTSALGGLAGDPATRVIILRGTGNAFCAGHDLKEMQAARQTPDKGAAYFLDLFTRCGAVMRMISALPQPVIAEVHGIATAAGCQLVASCDMAVAADGTRFGVNGVNIGLFCSTPMVALSRNVPRKAAFEMLTTGEFIDAARARELGLVNRVVPAAELSGATLALAQVVAGKLTAAVKIGKRAFYEQASMSLADAYAYTARVMAENMMLAETAEGIQAFIDKRHPEWRDQ